MLCWSFVFSPHRMCDGHSTNGERRVWEVFTTHTQKKKNFFWNDENRETILIKISFPQHRENRMWMLHVVGLYRSILYGNLSDMNALPILHIGLVVVFIKIYSVSFCIRSLVDCIWNSYPKFVRIRRIAHSAWKQIVHCVSVSYAAIKIQNRKLRNLIKLILVATV